MVRNYKIRVLKKDLEALSRVYSLFGATMTTESSSFNLTFHRNFSINRSRIIHEDYNREQ